ncbi:hypothetical protein B4168_1309 [Anoxybacillus flavithermus]|nr:hypothetical protein B4168_1309 [Anoxybacillus flavithermus]OAO83657.1 hypothetical protein GT23_4151 [Parageobacillus thermoglucosidasius]
MYRISSGFVHPFSIKLICLFPREWFIFLLNDKTYQKKWPVAKKEEKCRK